VVSPLHLCGACGQQAQHWTVRSLEAVLTWSVCVCV
jgi:hypothetical protein